jgi:ferric-dicitrate binding protein FerR (iron transport regulator)
VNAGSTDIEVLGTSFNINAYKEEHDTRTTLLDGSVKIYGANANVVLKPGQQAITDRQLKVESDVNTDQVIAWKNGLFYFNSTGIATVMQQLSRWYDIDVRYEGRVPDIRITGKMDKGLNLNEIMEFLTKMEVKCRLLGRTVVVSNN